MPTYVWDATFEALPADTDEVKYGATKIRDLKLATSEREELEHNFKAGTQPFHKAGKCSILFIGTTTEVNALTGMPTGGLAWDTTLSVLKRYSGSAWVICTLDHGNLTGLADDDHTQYQLESEKGNANGYAALDTNSKVTQNPAGANVTPTANGIPLANANAKIDQGWVGVASNQAANGYLQLPGNMYLQWGFGSAVAGANTVITFPIPFPTNCVTRHLTIREDIGVDRYALKITASINKSNLSVMNTNPANLLFHWVAIGN